MKYFIVADVHGFYDEMQRALNEKGFDPTNPEHIFVSLGDITDRGPKPRECIEFAMSLPEERRILITGNHELLLLAMLHRGFSNSDDHYIGTEGTVYSFLNEPRGGWLENKCRKMLDDKLFRSYIAALEFFHETDKSIFVHGWIPTNKITDRDSTWFGRYVYDEKWRDGNWENATWLNGMRCWHDGVVELGKTIYCGHWHASYGNAYYHNDGIEFPDPTRPETHADVHMTPFVDDGIVALDACTALSGFVNCVVVEE